MMLALLQALGALVLFISPDTYRETHGHGPAWCGQAFASTNVVRVIVPPPPGCPPVETTLAHEYCHLLGHRGHDAALFACWRELTAQGTGRSAPRKEV